MEMLIKLELLFLMQVAIVHWEYNFITITY